MKYRFLLNIPICSASEVSLGNPTSNSYLTCLLKVIKESHFEWLFSRCRYKDVNNIINVCMVYLETFDKNRMFNDVTFYFQDVDELVINYPSVSQIMKDIKGRNSFFILWGGLGVVWRFQLTSISHLGTSTSHELYLQVLNVALRWVISYYKHVIILI